MDLQRGLGTPRSRRDLLKQFGALVGTGIGLDLGLTQVERAAAKSNPINHVLVACQENRTFDEYFGSYPKAGGFGIPAGYYQPDGTGGKVYPYHYQSSSTPDVSHTWQSIHSEWDTGKMDGVYTTDGSNAMPPMGNPMVLLLRRAMASPRLATSTRSFISDAIPDSAVSPWLS